MGVFRDLQKEEEEKERKKRNGMIIYLQIDGQKKNKWKRKKALIVSFLVREKDEKEKEIKEKERII